MLTLRGHSVLHTLIRAHFSPARTGHRYIYTGCARGQCVGMWSFSKAVFEALLCVYESALLFIIR